MSRALGAGTFEASPATTAREVLDAAISLSQRTGENASSNSARTWHA
ncbi:hypothetical protein INT80_05670 [Gallibacterium anatis]|uniref:Uncharacterized protein n=1 Tax=Gallibacterium anatis TaxID=750 RepID=A0A930UTP9_9PAST|nr:hypothetical protein [Gallibacterium anatis]